MQQAERLVGVGAVLGEGPIWRTETETAIWVDIVGAQIHETSMDGLDRVLLAWHEPVSSVHLNNAGAVFFTGRYSLFSLTGDEIARVAHGGVRLNDGAVAPDGDLVVGTMGYPLVEPEVGGLFQLGTDGVAEIASGVTISNGIGWSGDGLTMFYVDTPTQRIDVFDVNPDTGQVDGRRPWAEIDPALGNPDGLCVDSEGGVWVAMWGGGKVIRLDNGELSHIVEVPTPYVTCPAFAGLELDRLVITTASEPFEGDVPPGAGDVYTAAIDVAGPPPFRLGAWATPNRC